MLKLVYKMKDLPFGQLMQIYSEEYDAEAQQDFYDYLRSCFFRTDGAVYALWLEGDQAVSALRLEPWKDGLLLTGLETAPDRRNCGYALCLLRAALQWQRERGNVRVYSHIHKQNSASIHLHEKCGFRRISDTAAYLDGSVDSRGATYLCDA